LQKQQGESSRQRAYPEIRCVWIRYPHLPTADLNKAILKCRSYTIFGGKETGKSSLAETIASKYEVVLDLFGSRDNEGLGWLRSPKLKKALLLKGKDVMVDCNCADVKNTVDFKLTDLDNYNIIISAAAFYRGIKDEWKNLALLMDKLWYRASWSQIACLLIREGSSLIASRHIMGEDQTQATNYTVYVLKEMRHCGFAIALDTIRWFGVDRDYRAVTDYTFFKAIGTEGVPKDLHFLYRYFKPSKMQQMKPDEFRVLSREASIGIGTFDLPAWHKREGENLLKLFDINVSYPDKPMEEEKPNQRVNEYEHIRIIKLRVDSPEGSLGMEKIGKQIGRSSKTVFEQLRQHNNYVQSIGECPRCAKVDPAYSKRMAD
jgi:hypothetical protein